MNGYKYQLRKGGRKEVCPACGKRRFVPYVLAEDNRTIQNPSWGRCDREQSCGYFMKPDGNVQVSVTPQEPKRPIRWFDRLGDRKPEANSLFYYSAWLIGMDKARETFERYLVSSNYGDWCTFWQVSDGGEIRAGKAIHYVDGHRDKKAVPPVRWLHADKAFDLFRDGDELRQCFFGEHLLKSNCGRRVAVVESEKTAMLMSAIDPTYTWLASGGSCCLKDEVKNKVLDGYEVTVFPDNGQYFQWRQIAIPKGWEVDDSCLNDRPDMNEGYDILDLYERWLISRETAEAVGRAAL